MQNKANANLLLYKAVQANDYAEAKKLVELYQAKPTILAGLDNPLCIAIEKNNLDMFKLLIQAGVALNTTHSGNPLHTAVGHERPEMIRLLIRAGADVTITLDKQTPIERATVSSNRWPSVAAFTEKKNPPASANYGAALVAAVEAQQYDMVDALLKTGLTESQKYWPKKSEFNEPDPHYPSLPRNYFLRKKYALHLAVEANDIRMIYLLRSHGIKDKKETYEYEGGHYIVPHRGVTASQSAGKSFDLIFALTCKDPAQEYENLISPDNARKSLFSTQKLGKTADEVSGPLFSTYKSKNSNKEDLLAEILESKGDQRQQALLECLSPDTYYGKIFHAKRSLFAPALNRGTLKCIVTAVNDSNIEIKKIDNKLRASLLANSEIKRHCPQLFTDLQDVPPPSYQLATSECKA